MHTVQLGVFSAGSVFNIKTLDMFKHKMPLFYPLAEINLLKDKSHCL